jgi:HSP20 family protein
MSVTRFEPFPEFDRLFSIAASGTRAPLGMPMDVYRGEDGSYHVEVTVEHSVLTIQAERTPHYGGSGQGHCRRTAPGGRSPGSSP